MSALADKIKQSGAVLGAQEIGNALYGLQNMGSDSEEVKKILLALVEKIERSGADLDAQEIGNALYGLQNMDSDSEEVKKILLALVEKIKRSSAELGAQEIGNALYGLQNMDSDSEEVKKILLALEAKYPAFLNLDDQLAYKQIVICYIKLNSNIGELNSKQFSFLFSEFKATSSITDTLRLNQAKNLLLDNLKKDHLKNNTLDLHGLDHLSARFILDQLLSNSQDLPTKIIFGRGGHSKTANMKKMTELVQESLSKNNLDGEMTELGSCKVLPKTPTTSPASAKDFQYKKAGHSK